MSDESNDLSVFPTSAPAVFCDPDACTELFTSVLEALSAVVNVGPDQLQSPTACAGFNVHQLRNHTLGWLQYFAAALKDPSANSPRPDPDTFSLDDGTQASDVVTQAMAHIHQAIAADAAGQMITMQSSRMAGDGVLAMALGEYMIHAWDLATATGQTYAAPPHAVEPAHEFLKGMVAPEYRGPDTGFFDQEIPVPESATPFQKLLGFAGRNPLN